MVTKTEGLEELITNKDGSRVLVDGNTPAYPTELTPAVLAALGAPVPASEIKLLPGGLKYTTEKWVRSRLDGVVSPAGWQSHDVVTYLPQPAVMHEGLKDESTILGTIVCDLTVLGVTKSDVIDIEITPKMFGTPSSNAKARAFKRVARLFGVAEELWEKDAPVADTSYSTTQPTASKQASGDGKLASPAQVSYLSGKTFQVPANVAALLTGGKARYDENNRFIAGAGEASALIEQLKTASAREEYDDEPTRYIAQALKKIGRADLVHVLNGAQVGYDDDDLD